MTSKDFLDHFRFEAEVFPQYTLHHSFKSNRERGRLEKVETRWDRKKQIGEGQFGQVWHELNHQPNGTQRHRAVKLLQKSRIASFGIDFKKELLALAKFSKEEYRQTELLVAFYGWYETEQTLFLAMEWFELGDLARYISDISTEDEVRQIATDLLGGLRIMHNEGFAHRDLKPQNIFVVKKPPHSRRWWVKIGDFGIAKRAMNDETALRTQTGTPYFLAPEVQGFIEGDEETSAYTKAVDLWSLGCVLYNTVAGQVPFLQPRDLNRYCRDQSTLSMSSLYPKVGSAGISFLEQLLEPHPTQRLTVATALEHPWIVDAASEILSLSTSRLPDIDPGKTLETHTVTISTASGRHNDSVQGVTDDPKKATAILGSLSETSNEPGSGLSTSLMLGMEYSWRWRRSIRIKAHNDSVSKVIFSPNGEVIASCSFDGSVKLWDAKTGQALRTLTDYFSVVRGAAFSPDSKIIATGSTDESVTLWRVKTGQMLRMVDHSQAVCGVTFSPDGKTFASCSAFIFKLWATATGQCLIYETYGTQPSTNGDIAFSPDGKTIASCFEHAVALWDLATGSIHRYIAAHTDDVSALAFSLDGRILASCSFDKTVKLWSTSTGEALQTFQGHSEDVTDIAFSPDGTTVASASKDKSAHFWNLSTGHIATTLYTVSGIKSIAFGPDGQTLVLGMRNGEVEKWII